MPDTPAVTAILDEVEARMGNITIANGYNFTQQQIQRAMLTPWRGIDLPGINIWATGTISERKSYDTDEREIALFIEMHELTRDDPFIDVAEKLVADGVTALNRRTNATPGISKSDTGPLEDMSGVLDVAFKISVDGDAAETATCNWTGAITGALVAAQMQTQIQVLGGNKATVTVIFNAGRYIITSSTIGVSSAVVITPGAALSCTDELRIGLTDSGIESIGEAAAPAVSDDQDPNLGDTVSDVILNGYDYIIGEGGEPFCGVLLKFSIKYLTESMDMTNYNRE